MQEIIIENVENKQVNLSSNFAKKIEEGMSNWMPTEPLLCYYYFMNKSIDDLLAKVVVATMGELQTQFEYKQQAKHIIFI